MASPASQGRRRSQAKPNTEDHALNMIASEAEARLAAKRTARAEARSIRMKELERMQHEADEKMDREYQRSLLTDDAVKQRTARVADKLQARIAAASEGEMNGPVSQEMQIKALQENLREMSERFKKAMVSNAQLDNEKQALSYQVDCLKDRLEDSEERVENLKQEILDKSRECNRLSRENKNNIEDLNKMREQLILRDKLLEEHGIPTDGSEQPDMSQSELSASRINESLTLDSIELDQSGLNKSRESSRRSSLPDDRESLLEQIKMLKERVSDLRREPEMDDARLRDVENLQTSGDENEHIAAMVDPDLERSETFEDITDEAIEIRDRLRVGMIVNNNERSEDYDVIEQNLQQGELVSFEDKSYENSYLTESITDSMMASFASTVVTTESIESERPLEISMTAALEEESAAVDATDEIPKSKTNTIAKAEKQSEKDFNEYDIVESTNDPGSGADAATVSSMEHSSEHISPEGNDNSSLDDFSIKQQGPVTEGVLPLQHNHESVLADMVDINPYDSVDLNEKLLLQHHVVSNLDDGEDVGSDIVDVEMPISSIPDETEDQVDKSKNYPIASEIISSENPLTSDVLAAKSISIDKNDFADLKYEQGQDFQEVQDEVNQTLIDPAAVVYKPPDHFEQNSSTESILGIVNTEIMMDFKPSPRFSTDSSDGQEVNCEKQEERNAANDTHMNFETGLDHKCAEDTFLNIESDEAFFDAKSEITSDLAESEPREQPEMQNDNENFRKDSQEVTEKFEKVLANDVERATEIGENDSDRDRISEEKHDEGHLTSESLGAARNMLKEESPLSTAYVTSNSEVSADAEDKCFLPSTKENEIEMSLEDVLPEDQSEESTHKFETENDDESIDIDSMPETKLVAEETVGDDMVHIRNVNECNLHTEGSKTSVGPAEVTEEKRIISNDEQEKSLLPVGVSTTHLSLESQDAESFENVEITDLSTAGYENLTSGNEGSKLDANTRESCILVPDESGNINASTGPNIEEEQEERSSSFEETKCDKSHPQVISASRDASTEKELDITEQDGDERGNDVPKDRLLEAYESRQKLSTSSPGSCRKSTSPQPVPKQRKKNKKKKKKTKEVVKVLQQETTIADPHQGDELQGKLDDHEIPLQPQLLGIDASMEYCNPEGAHADHAQVVCQEALLDSGVDQDEGFKDVTYLEVRRPSGSSISDASDAEATGKPGQRDRKDRKKSKKDSKKDGCKNQ